MKQRTIAALSLSALLLASAAAANAAPGRTPADDVEAAAEETAEKKDRCSNGASCIALSVICYGEFRCVETRWYGCARGVCIPHPDRSY
jgi:hypothetical protein